MAKKRQDLNPNKNGVYERNLGKRLTRLKRTDPKTKSEWEESKFIRPKFRLGKAKADLSNLRLEQLWDLVVEGWSEGEFQFNCRTDEPLWDDATYAMAMAMAVSKGKMQVALDRHPDFNGADNLNARWIRKLIN